MTGDFPAIRMRRSATRHIPWMHCHRSIRVLETGISAVRRLCKKMRMGVTVRICGMFPVKYVRENIRFRDFQLLMTKRAQRVRR